MKVNIFSRTDHVCIGYDPALPYPGNRDTVGLYSDIAYLFKVWGRLLWPTVTQVTEVNKNVLKFPNRSKNKIQTTDDDDGGSAGGVGSDGGDGCVVVIAGGGGCVGGVVLVMVVVVVILVVVVMVVVVVMMVLVMLVVLVVV